MTKRIPHKKDYTEYFKELNEMIDVLFQAAHDRQLTWDDMADRSELSKETVRRLGTRTTRFPQYRTIVMLAKGLGGQLRFVEGMRKPKLKIRWKPESFHKQRTPLKVG